MGQATEAINPAVSLSRLTLGHALSRGYCHSALITRYGRLDTQALEKPLDLDVKRRDSGYILLACPMRS